MSLLVILIHISVVLSYQNSKRAHVDLAYKLLVEDQLRQGKYVTVNNDALNEYLMTENSCEKTCPIQCLSGFPYFLFYVT
jgi:hypothetical protein